MSHKFIAIEGNIGAGKSSLASMLAKDFDANLILEQFNDNPFLPKFYANPGQYAFSLELSFLAERYHQLKQFFPLQELFRTYTVSDYYIYKSLIFAKANLDQDEYKLYYQLFNIMHEKLPKPDLLVYLHLDLPNLKKNIKKRGRIYEQNIEDSYLIKIQETYMGFLKVQKDFPVLIIDTNNIDFIKEKKDFHTIKEKMDCLYPAGITRIVI
ncbi:MAG: deoxynucleoside kinase [Bacteroidota bacterium]|nr:deoxynucleoside kinase [Bacteroidota bacterium]